MKASELRIGNKYQLSKSTLGGGICQINTPSDMAIAFQLLESGDLLPIPITKEWLVDEIDGVKNSHPNFGLYFTNGYGYRFCFGWLSLSSKLWQSNELVVEVKYVHQLQNLYFALTGEELTLQP